MQNQPQVKINCLDSCQMRFSVWFLTIYSKVLCVSHPGSHWRQGLANADVKPAMIYFELTEIPSTVIPTVTSKTKNTGVSQ